MTRFARTLLALLVMALALPAIAQVTDEEIDRARSEVNEIMAEAQALGDEVQDAWAHQFALDREITDLTASIELARVKIVETEKKLEEVAVEMYMGSSTAASMQVLFSASDESYGAGVEYLRNVTGNDADVINQLRSFRVELDRQTGRLEEASAEQEVLTAELEAKAGDLQGQLVEAQAVYDGLVAQQAAEEAARRAAEEAARLAAEEAARNATTTTDPGSPDTTEGESEAPTETTTPPGGDARCLTAATGIEWRGMSGGRSRLVLRFLGRRPIGGPFPPGRGHDRSQEHADRRDLLGDDPKTHRWQSEWSRHLAPLRRWRHLLLRPPGELRSQRRAVGVRGRGDRIQRVIGQRPRVPAPSPFRVSPRRRGSGEPVSPGSGSVLISPERRKRTLSGPLPIGPPCPCPHAPRHVLGASSVTESGDVRTVRIPTQCD